MFRVTAQMMIQMMDKNEDGKIDDSELNYDFDFEEYGFDTANVSSIFPFSLKSWWWIILLLGKWYCDQGWYK